MDIITKPTNKNIITKIYKKKNGELVEKQYNQSKYNENYYKKHATELNEKIKCECGYFYTQTNKSHHTKTKLHQMYLYLNGEIHRLNSIIVNNTSTIFTN
jgi:hypothetical protein